MKVTISLDDELMSRIDSYAEKNYMSRSGFISFSCTQYLNQVEAMQAINNVSLAMRKIADKGEIDAESMKHLEDFERLITFFAK